MADRLFYPDKTRAQIAAFLDDYVALCRRHQRALSADQDYRLCPVVGGLCQRDDEWSERLRAARSDDVLGVRREPWDVTSEGKTSTIAVSEVAVAERADHPVSIPVHAVRAVGCSSGPSELRVNEDLVFLFDHTSADDERLQEAHAGALQALYSGEEWTPSEALLQHLSRPKKPGRTVGSAAALSLAPWLRHHADCQRERREGECSCGLNDVLLRLRPELAEARRSGD